MFYTYSYTHTYEALKQSINMFEIFTPRRRRTM